MEKIISVCSVPTNEGTTEAIILRDLKKFGFSVGDTLTVKIIKNKITITKKPAKVIFAEFKQQNPDFERLSNELGLVINE